MCILGRVIGEQRSHGSGVSPNFLHRAGEPLFDGPIHQRVREQEHHHNGKNGKQEPNYHHAGAELRTQHSQASLRKNFEQIAREDECQRHEKQKNHCRERCEKQELLIVIRIQEWQVK